MLFLSLALLPLGIIAFYVTTELSRANAVSARLSLLALTEQASSDEKRLIQRAFGAGEALGVVMTLIRDDPEACSRYLSEYLRHNTGYSFVGFIPPSGRMTCSSAPEPLDLSDDPRIRSQLDDPHSLVLASSVAPVSRQPVIVVNQPVYLNDEFLGLVSVSVPQSRIERESVSATGATPPDLVMFNSRGEILISSVGLDAVESLLPEKRTLEDIALGGQTAFNAPDRSGMRRVFAMVPIIGGNVFALSSWPESESPSRLTYAGVTSRVFPLLMWLASLAVAFLAINRLVLRHVGRLRGQMRAFALRRELPRLSRIGGMPSELRQIEVDFRRMADSILHDEAQIEDSVREKNILLKEVHHRVKNNLQLISSIMNMQRRASRRRETRDALSRLQDRILGLATIHRNLYQAENLNRVNAGELLSELSRQILSAALMSDSDIDVEMQFDEVVLYPDQAVPLSLLNAEALTNALKHVSESRQEKAWITVHLRTEEAGKARLEIANSVGEEVAPEADGPADTGLGTQLIRAFTMQLNATSDITHTDREYRIGLTIDIAEFVPDPQDY